MNAQQRPVIFALAKAAGLDRDALHDVVWRLTGEVSIAKLTNEQAARTIDELKRLAGQGEPLGWLTSAQRGKTYTLCRSLGWVDDKGAVDLARLEGFVRVRFKIDHLNWVTMAQAGRIIEALKAMEAGGRGERKAAGV